MLMAAMALFSPGEHPPKPRSFCSSTPAQTPSPGESLPAPSHPSHPTSSRQAWGYPEGGDRSSARGDGIDPAELHQRAAAKAWGPVCGSLGARRLYPGKAGKGNRAQGNASAGLSSGKPGSLGGTESFPRTSDGSGIRIAPTAVSSDFFPDFFFYSVEMQSRSSQALYDSIPETDDTHHLTRPLQAKSSLPGFSFALSLALPFLSIGPFL